MGQITVSIHDHQYTLACRDGEEERLAGLASYVDGKARSLVTKLGQVSEARLLLMAALLIADELQDVHDQTKGGRRALRRCPGRAWRRAVMPACWSTTRTWPRASMP